MKKGNVTIIVFALMNFVISMSGFLFSGILDKVALSLNVPVANAGLLNTMHAYGAAIGVPLALIVSRRINRVVMLKVMLLLSIVLTVLLVVSTNFNAMLVLRLLSGVTINSFGVLATGIVVSLVAKERLGRSMALLIAGNSLALVVGIPLTRLVSDAVDWRGIFWTMTAIMAACFVYLHLMLDKQGQRQAPVNLGHDLAYLKNPKVWRILLFTFLMFMGYHGVYNYITPYLLELFPQAETSLSAFLVLFGLGSFLGNALGGRVCDRIGYAKAMVFGAAAQLVVVALMLPGQSVLWATVALVALWVMSSWFLGLQVNTGVAQETENKSSFLLSLTGSAIQLGSALGSSLTAVLIAQGFTRQMVYLSLITAAAITLLQWHTLRRHHA